MTDKLITHEEALKKVQIGEQIMNLQLLPDKIKPDWAILLSNYITQQEQFSKDVARYFELLESNVSYVFLGTQDISNEFDELEEKLSKVGKVE